METPIITHTFALAQTGGHDVDLASAWRLEEDYNICEDCLIELARQITYSEILNSLALYPYAQAKTCRG